MVNKWVDDPKRLEMAAAEKKQAIADYEAEIKVAEAKVVEMKKHLAELKK